MVITALQTGPDFAEEFRQRFLAPKLEMQQLTYQRAAGRGELAPGADPTLLGPALPGNILLHRAVVLGEPVTPDLVERVIVPAATGRPFTLQEQP